MNPKICLTFDDGLIDQYKWAKVLHNNGIKGTFYINPFNIGIRGFLTLAQLKEMQGWGHLIANHFWIHESPANLSFDFETNLKILLGNLACAKKWLYENGFSNGAELVALTYGSEGGKWTQEYIDEIHKNCKHIRDYNKDTVINRIWNKGFLTSCEKREFIVVDDCLSCYCFHGNRTFIPITDEEFINLIEKMMDDKSEFMTISEVANAQ